MFELLHVSTMIPRRIVAVALNKHVRDTIGVGDIDPREPKRMVSIVTRAYVQDMTRILTHISRHTYITRVNRPSVRLLTVVLGSVPRAHNMG